MLTSPVVKYETKARHMLAKILRKGVKQEDVAQKIGATQALISKWVRGEGRPSAPYLVLLDVHYNIPPRAWLTAPERRRAA